jgi:hypothetical protein
VPVSAGYCKSRVQICWGAILGVYLPTNRVFALVCILRSVIF